MWCDIEGTIERWVLSAGVPDTAKDSPSVKAVEFFKVCPFTEGAFVLLNGHRESEQDEESHMYGNMARYAWALYPKIASNGYNREAFIALLRQELLKLEHAFGEYLANEVETNDGYAEKCKTLYQAMEWDGKKSGDGYYSSTSVLSFNYTDLIERFFDGGEDGAFANIHGKLGQEIIFGIDGKDCMDNPDAVAFTKTFRLMRRGGTRTDKLISTANSANLRDATDVIKFYGHSLGKADYSYFQSIFDGVDLYESKTILVFYYPYDSTDDGEEKNEAWRNRLANSINKLLVDYGATMDNKDHGKNLMHKLLLEGRLIIRGIQLN
ncbi:AbiH family protein [Olsenella sp. Marseille-P4559]|uniref:AbiH family protein n=1 Tax=Olsenella sp. Marseille-P4559 TaxID=2364795 RepID=UPI00352F4B41